MSTPVGTVKKIVFHAVIIAAISVALLWGNTLARQREQFSRGEEALSRADFVAAVAGYEAAIHMYTPWSSLVGKSAARLWSLGEEMERKGDGKRALIAYRSLRSSFHAVRGLTSPGTEWIARCDTKIAKLVAKRNDVH
jgi:hypothetical protein